MTKNKYGLPRRPGNAVAREIRRRCGFGCVICGNAIITYEHFDPPYKDAKEHNPKGMTLLCGSHQLESSKGLLSKSSIALADRDPICKQQGYANHFFDLGGRRPNLLLGGINATRCGPALAFNNKIFLAIQPPDLRSHRWRLSCSFTDEAGERLCEIVENELLVGSENFDVRQQGCTFSVHAGWKKILEMELDASLGLVIKKYYMRVGEARLIIEEEDLSKIHPSLGKETVIRFELPDGAVQTYSSCSVISDTGLNIQVLNGGLQFGPLLGAKAR